jgi:hypothetical protein
MAKKLKNIQKQFEELHKQMKKEGLNAFKEAAKEVLDKHPTVEAFKWNQYTPGWNDGSPCTFHVNWDSITAKPFNPPEGDAYTFDGSDFFEDPYNLPEDIAAAVEEFSELIGPEELMEMIFGDNVEVTVTRESIETAEYDCGY